MADDTPHHTNSPDHAQQPDRPTNGPSPASGPTPNLRSCVTCRRRKVKCDKKLPCSNCVRGRIECVFPGPGRAPRRSRKPQDSELLERLRRLEGVVSSLNAQVEGHEQEAAEQGRHTPQSSTREQQSAYHEHGSTHGSPNTEVDASVDALATRFDRLVVEKGRSRYIANGLWTSLNNEVEDLKAILVEPSDDEDDANTPDASHHSSQHQGFIFGYSSTNVDLSLLRPPPDQACQFWEIYKERVEPLLRVLHVPTFERTLHDAVLHPNKISKALETLLFVVYYGAITSSTDVECMDKWGKDRKTLLNQYRFGLEQALARANFLYCNELVVLQAYVIFLALLRGNDDPRLLWTLVGLATRIAQTLGIHRDGTQFQLPPFEVEMRRRLWWQICSLDGRSTEDHGISSMFFEMKFDAKMPLNINDSDLDPDMVDFPEERQGFTDMSLCLLRYDAFVLVRRILSMSSETGKAADVALADKEKYINDCLQKMEIKYFKDSDMSDPICWVTATLMRLVFSKLWLMGFHPPLRKDDGSSHSQETKDKLFITSLEVMECSILLESESKTMKWSWHFNTWIQWHAIAFLLSELSIRTRGAAVERAWRALEATAHQWWCSPNDCSSTRKQGLVWKPIKRLMMKARAARERELALERASQELKNGPLLFQHVSSEGSTYALPTSTEQPSPENLDSLLKPLAPRLGENSAATPLSWSAHILTTGAPEQINMTNDANTNNINHHPTFPDVLNFNLDSIGVNPMDDMTLDGTCITNPMNRYPPLAPAMSHNTYPANMNGMNDANLPNNMNNSMNGMNGMTFPPAMNTAFPIYGSNVFPAMDDTSPTMNELDSPIMEDESMGWTAWDDMLNQLGIEGQGGSGGLVSWI